MRSRLVLLVLIASMASASANAGRPWRGGDPAGEPAGITDIAIAREELVIDLRALGDRDGLVKVGATYHLDNQADAKQLDLVFATGSTTSAFEVTLDGHPVATRSRPGATLPASWLPPATTPLFDGGTYPYELHDPATPIGFELLVPPGRHDLVITHAADALHYHARDVTLLHQFGYVLSPARTWAGFGGLDLTVHVPAGWRAAVTPTLERTGDTLHATFTSVPADAVAISVEAPTGIYGLLRIVGHLLFAVVALGGVFCIVWWTRASERRHPHAITGSGLAAVGRGVVWGAAFLAAGLFAVAGPDLALPAGQADHYGYGGALALVGVVLGALVAIVLGAIVSRVTARRMHAPADAGS